MSANDHEGNSLLVGLGLVFLLGTIVGSLVGSVRTMDKVRNQAIEAGVAEWQVDPKTGVTTFIFKKGGCQ